MNDPDFQSLPIAAIGRAPPHSIEAEEYLLSCCLLDGSDTYSKSIDARLSPSAFYLPANRIIFDAIGDVFANHPPITIEVVAEQLKSSQQLEAVGGWAYLFQVAGRVPTTAQACYFIEKVKELHTLRELIKVGTAAVEHCFAYTGDLPGLMTGVTNSLLALQTDGSAQSVKWADAIAAAISDTEQLANSPAPLADELTWGFSDLDRYFGKPRTGQLVVIGGRPSTGKSSLARAVAVANARNADGVLILTLEVKSKRLALSLAQTRSGVSFKSIEQRQASAADIAHFIRNLHDLKQITGLHVAEDPVITAASVVAKVRALKVRRPLKLVIVDQLNLMSDAVGTYAMKLPEAIARITRALKILAQSEDVCVMLLAQLNRRSAHDNSEPALHDLRDSGMIESDADKVVLLHRPATNPTNDQEQDENARVKEQPSFYVNAIQAKGRDDGTSRVGLNFDRATATFREIQRP
jgi:replicative DNA helicase